MPLAKEKTPWETIETLTTDAIDFIKEHISSDTVFVGFSGGKDSIVVADLAKRAGIDYQLYYSATGIDPPEIVQFIRKYYPECIFLKPKQTFWRDLSVHTVPSDRLRWCCHLLKKEPGWQIDTKQRIMGIRAEESYRRKKMGKINDYWLEKKGFTDYHPIFSWKEWAVWDYIEVNNLPYPILYSWGFDRTGCVVCPYHSEKTGKLHKKYKKHWPKFFKLFETEVTKLYNKRVGQGKIMHHKTAQEFIEAWYLDDSTRWYADTKQNLKDKKNILGG